jgi:hypothetical protein
LDSEAPRGLVRTPCPNGQVFHREYRENGAKP